MSRKTVEFKRKIQQTTRTPEAVARLLPDGGAVVRGTGRTRMVQDKAGLRGEGSVVTRPMHPDKAARLAALVKQ